MLRHLSYCTKNNCNFLENQNIFVQVIGYNGYLFKLFYNGACYY